MCGVRKISTINVARGNDHDLYYYIRASHTPARACIGSTGSRRSNSPSAASNPKKYISVDRRKKKKKKKEKKIIDDTFVDFNDF